MGVVSFPQVIEAVAAALVADAALSGLLKGDKVYPWAVSGRRALSYITFTFPGVTDQDARLMFSRNANSGTIQLDIWADSGKKAAMIYAEVARVLHNVKLPLDGDQSLIAGGVSLLFILRDPEDDTVHHGVARYEWETLHNG